MAFILSEKITPSKAIKFGSTPKDTREVNTVYYRLPSTMGGAATVEALAQQLATKTLRTLTGDKKIKATADEVMTMHNVIATLMTCITGWDGPDFGGTAYSRDVWENMPTAENMWWMERIFEAISEETKPPTEMPEKGGTAVEPDPKD